MIGTSAPVFYTKKTKRQTDRPQLTIDTTENYQNWKSEQKKKLVATAWRLF